jgi:hypothetical protein
MDSTLVYCVEGLERVIPTTVDLVPYLKLPSKHNYFDTETKRWKSYYAERKHWIFYNSSKMDELIGLWANPYYRPSHITLEQYVEHVYMLGFMHEFWVIMKKAYSLGVWIRFDY